MDSTLHCYCYFIVPNITGTISLTKITPLEELIFKRVRRITTTIDLPINWVFVRHVQAKFCRKRKGSGSPTWRYFLTLPWATMTSDGARRVWIPRGEEAEAETEEEDEGEKAAVQGSVEAHDGDAIAQAEAVCFSCSGVELTRTLPLIHSPTPTDFLRFWCGLALSSGPCYKALPLYGLQDLMAYGFLWAVKYASSPAQKKLCLFFLRVLVYNKIKL
jgi:hypothetical protein